MKTTAEEKLLRQLEKIVEQGAVTMTRREFRKANSETNRLALDVIRKHKRMIDLWTKMRARINGRTKRILDK